MAWLNLLVCAMLRSYIYQSNPLALLCSSTGEPEASPTSAILVGSRPEGSIFVGS